MSSYEPGKPYVPAGQANWMGTKRLLSSDEYNFYHSVLDEDSNYSPAIKAGVAVVLMADLKRWAGANQILVDDYLSEAIKTYVNLFNQFADDDENKAIAREEIKNFDLYLIHTQAPGRGKLHLAIEDSRRNFATRLAIAKQEAIKNMSIEEILKAEDEERELKEEEKLMQEQAIVIAEAIQNHMAFKIREYFAAAYDNSMGKFFMDERNSKREYDLRMTLIKNVQDKSMNPMEALAKYTEILDEFAGHLGDPTKKTVIGGLYDHPMLKKLVR